MFKSFGFMKRYVDNLTPNADFPNEIYRIQAAMIIEETVSPKLVGQFVLSSPTL